MAAEESPSYYTLVPLVTFATVDFVYNCKQATPLTWGVIIIEGVLVVLVYTHNTLDSA